MPRLPELLMQSAKRAAVFDEREWRPVRPSIVTRPSVACRVATHDRNRDVMISTKKDNPVPASSTTDCGRRRQTRADLAPPLVKAAPDAIMSAGDVITRALLKGDLDNSDYGWAKDRGFGEAAGAPAPQSGHL
jgi:hypothetical protein